MNFPLFPDQASTMATEVDAIYFVLSALTAVFFLLVCVLVVVFSIRYRRGNKVDRSRPIHSDLRMELAWTIIPLILGLAVFFWAAKPYASVYNPPAHAREIFVVGKQWMWHIQHGNGVRENNELHVPTGEPVKLTLISQDVIHDFSIPAFRVKRDAIPGRYTNCWFQATKPGKYHLFCAEYCGTYHSSMVGEVYVMTPADFQAWLSSGGSHDTTMAQQAGHIETMADRGGKLYTQLACGSCHDPDGLQRGPSLNNLYGLTVTTATGQQVLADEAYIRNAILNPKDTVAPGYAQVMPSYKDQLNEEQTLQLIAYIKSLNVKLTKPTPPGANAPAPTTKKKPGAHATANSARNDSGDITTIAGR